MKPTGLIRTFLTSVFALLFFGGMVTAQGQDIIVDEDDTPESDATTIADGISLLTSGDRLVVVAGDYRDTDSQVDLNTLPSGVDNLTIQIRRDDSDDTDQLTINTLILDGNHDVTLESDGDGFLQVRAEDGSGVFINGTEFDFALQDGTLSLASAGVLQFQDPVNAGGGSLNVYRSDGASISGSAPQYLGDISRLEYAPGAAFDAGPELGETAADLPTADVSRVSTLAIDDAGGATTELITFPVNSLTVDALSHVSDNVRVEGDFTVNGNVATGGNIAVTGDLTAAGDVDVANTSDELTVDGTLRIDGSGTAPFLTVDGSVNGASSGSATTAGNLLFTSTIDRSATPGRLVEINGGTVVFNNATAEVTNTSTYVDELVQDVTGPGTFEIGGTLTVNPITDGDATAEDFTERLRATQPGSDFTVNAVAVDQDGDDETLVDLVKQAAGNAVITAGGTINEILVNNSGGSVTLTGGTVSGNVDIFGSGTLSITGDVTYDLTSAAAINNANSGEIAIASGATLTIDDSGDGAQTSANALANNGTSGVTGSGTLAFAGDGGDSFTVTTNAGEGNVLPNVTSGVVLAIQDDSGSATNVDINGILTANAAVTIGDGATGNVEVDAVNANQAVNFGDGANPVGTVDILGVLTADDNVNFGPGATTGNVTIEGDLIANAGTVDVSKASALLVEGNIDINPDDAGTVLDISGIVADVEGDFLRDGDPNATLTTTSGSTLRFSASNEDAIFSPGSKFTLEGNLIIDKGEFSVTLTEAVAVAGNVRIETPSSPSSPNNEFTLEENLFLTGANAATLEVNSAFNTTSTAFVIVDGPGTKTFERNVAASQIDVLPTLPNIRLRGDGGPDNITVATDLEFDDMIEILDGGITVTGGSDFDPVGTDAMVTRDLSGNNTEIFLATGNDNFNAVGNEYDLTYVGGATADVGSEFTGPVRDLSVEESGTIPQLTGNDEVRGVLTVESGAEIDDDTNGPFTLELSGSTTHSVVGLVSDVTLDVTGADATINGSTDDNNEARIDGLTASAANLTVSNIQQIDGDVVVANNGGLTLGLSDAAGEAGDNDANPTDDQTIGGTTTVNQNGSLTLASNVETVSDVATDGAMDFATFTLTLTGDGTEFNGDGNASYTSSSSDGRLVFDNRGGGTSQEFGTADVAVDNVTVDTPINLIENTAVAQDLQVNAEIDSDAASGTDNLRFSGQGTLSTAIAFSGEGELIAEGTTLTVTIDSDVSNFTVDSGGSTVTVNEDTDTPSPVDDDLTISDQFKIDSGALEHATDITVADADGGTAFDFNASDQNSITSLTESEDSAEPIAYMVFDGSTDATADLANPLTIPYLRVLGDDANLASGSADLTIGFELDLQEQFLTSGSSGGLVIAENADIRRSVYTSGNVLDEKPSFTSYNLFYEGANSPITTGNEVDDADGTISDITLLDAVEVDLTTTNAVSGTATVNGTLDINSGVVDEATNNGRNLVMADGSTLRRTSAGTVQDMIGAENTYTLEYYGGGAIDASNTEFLANGQVSLLEVNVTGTSSNLLPGANRQVGAFTLSAGAGQADLQDSGDNARVLTVTGQSTLNSGMLGTGTVSRGTLDADGNIEVNGATVAVNVQSSADFVFNSGNLNPVSLTFDGTDQQAFTLANSAVVNNLTMNQVTGSMTPQVSLSGAPLGIANQLTLTNGLLVVNEGQFVALSQVGGTNGPFAGTQPQPATVVHNAPAGSLSHIVGQVQQGVLAGTPGFGGTVNGRFEWPVGSMDEFRQAAITFTNNDPIDNSTNIRIAHVDVNPNGTRGLPFESTQNVNGVETTVNVGNYPEQYWDVEVTTGISTSQTFDVEFETGTQGFVDQFDGATDLRLIRRFDGSASENIWEEQEGPSSSYNNALFRRDTDGDGDSSDDNEQFTSVRVNSSTGGLVTQGTRFSLGLPSRMPAFTEALGDVTIDEGQTISGTFTASSQDLNQTVTVSLGDLPSGVVPDSVNFEPTDTGVDTTDSGVFSFTPGLAGGDRSFTFTVSATDEDATVDTSFTVTVENVNREPAFTAVLPDTTVATGETLTFDYVATDPDAEGLTFTLPDAPSGASINDSTGVFSWTPTFDQRGTNTQIVANVSDGIVSVTDTANVTVESSLAKGDPTGDGEVGSFDAAVTLFIFLQKDNPASSGVDESDPTAAQQFAADFNDDGEVTPFDASLILQEALNDNGQTASAKAATSSPSAGGAVSLRDLNVQNGVATVPVVLSSDASGVQSVAMNLDVDPSVASVSGISTNLPDGWIADYSATDDGTITVGMAGVSPAAPGQIATIQLKVSGSQNGFEPTGQFRLNAGAEQSLEVITAPDQFALKGNYPNPVKQSTTIEYSLKEASHVQISVYDILGREVATLVDEKQSAGAFDVTWDVNGSVGSGVYFYRIEAGDFTASKKMVVVR